MGGVDGVSGGGGGGGGGRWMNGCTSLASCSYKCFHASSPIVSFPKLLKKEESKEKMMNKKKKKKKFIKDK